MLYASNICTCMDGLLAVSFQWLLISHFGLNHYICTLSFDEDIKFEVHEVVDNLTRLVIDERIISRRLPVQSIIIQESGKLKKKWSN